MKIQTALSVYLKIYNLLSNLDMKYIFLKANLTTDIPLEMATSQHHADEKRSLIHEVNGRPEARTLEYFKNISKSVILKVYELYKLDFELFSYNLQGLID